MRFSTITKWEFKNTLSSRKFLMIFLMQLSVLVLMIVFLNMFIGNIESENGVTLSPSLTNFASMGVSDTSGLFEKQLNHEVLGITPLGSNESVNQVKSGKATAALIVPENSIGKIDTFQPITLNLFVDYADPKRSVVTEEVNSTVKVISSSISNQWISSLVPSTSTIDPDVREEKKGESLPLQLIKKMMVSILLFLPLFLFGNMIIDSIVGEKERKTGEILIAMPLSHGEIIIGKNLAVVLVIAVQVALWILILLVAGFDLKNPILVYLVIILTSIPIVGITSVIAAYSKNYKEAGIGLSFIYIGIVGFLVIPALAYISSKSAAANISPMTLVMRLFSGDPISMTDLMIPIISILIISAISYWITIKLFERDDIMFGPRPGIVRLALELVGIKNISKMN
ncbi:ABC transporter permease [Methanobacterium sp.]|jgi:ABC-2 type transport system permease protein|uniref:ABC transporter permease n=1 Tax=Methanobacterium sp. TaxID=2164 RepID=UPI00315876EF